MNYNQQTPPPYFGGGDNYNSYHNSQQQAVQTTSSVMKRVYFKMFLGLLVTAFVSLFCATSSAYLSFMSGHRIFFWGLLIAEVGIVIYLSTRLDRKSVV